jgi:hypothetical protein
VSLVGRWNITPWLEFRLGGGLGIGGVFGNVYLITDNSGCTAANANDPSKCYPKVTGVSTGGLNPKDPNTVGILQNAACPGGNTSLDTVQNPCYRASNTYPFNVRVIPVLNSLIGLRFKVQRHIFIHVEGGFRLAGFYAGGGPEYRF